MTGSIRTPLRRPLLAACAAGLLALPVAACASWQQEPAAGSVSMAGDGDDWVYDEQFEMDEGVLESGSNMAYEPYDNYYKEGFGDGTWLDRL